MNKRTTAVLFVILLLLIGFLLWQAWQQSDPATSDLMTTPLPTPLSGPVLMLEEYSLANLRRITITHLATNHTVDYLYQPDEEQPWQLASSDGPVPSELLTIHVRAFLGLRYTRALSVTASTNLADFGLDPPEYEIMIEVAEENGRLQSITYTIGQRTVTDIAYYTQQKGHPNTIYIIPSGFISNVINILNNHPPP